MAAFKDVYADYYDTGLKYEFITEISPNVWKISRKDDRMEYLAQDITDTLFTNINGDSKQLTNYGQLLRPDGHNILEKVKTILNHDNLVSLVDCFALEFSNSGKVGRERWFTVWDYCDAGNLGNLLVPPQPRPQDRESSPDLEPVNDDADIEMKNAAPEPKQEKQKFLPESFCWHVLLSLLKALTWLHDGVQNVVQGEDGEWHRRYEDLDWQPMLHRNITPQNIFIGYPRRREWYGPVKLGNYGQMFVSGHCQTPGDKQAPTFSKVIGPPPGHNFAPLENLIAWDAEHGSLYPHQLDQPYTIVSEYRAVGDILQAMMVEPTGRHHLRRIQTKSARVNLQNAKYTGRLRNFVVKLMEIDPWHKMPGAEQPNPTYVTTDLYCEAKEAFQYFMSTGNDEVDAFVTPQMAVDEDYLENTQLPSSMLFNSYENVRDILTQLD
ncbi:hypothetical protein F5Y19DRAFT_408684 [Xylariaceae sp. FL1651]|nr:hypothetical protein F5Y19DRAFT_408684 [Xylariaceae sp. FL1651]